MGIKVKSCDRNSKLAKHYMQLGGSAVGSAGIVFARHLPMAARLDKVMLGNDTAIALSDTTISVVNGMQSATLLSNVFASASANAAREAVASSSDRFISAGTLIEFNLSATASIGSNWGATLVFSVDKREDGA